MARRAASRRNKEKRGPGFSKLELLALLGSMVVLAAILGVVAALV